MNQLINIFEKANRIFLDKEKNLILSGVSERTLCGSLMQYIQKEIKTTKYNRYYVDVEYNRNNGKIKTIINKEKEVIPINCDIIVHSRGEIIEKDNLIAIEMKKSTARKKEKIKDKNRLIALSKEKYDDVWSYDGKSFPEHVCGYRLGIYYEIDDRKRQLLIEYYSQGILHYGKEVKF
ncbi:MAG: hypothetical protein HPY50_15265 [Firmicutes bacterium]|nr:hypothetical protein [Bacillota bacterium]